MIIGLTGLSGSGKSTAAQHLAHEHNWSRFKMATPLKIMLRSLYREMGVADVEIERRIEGDLKEQRDPLIGNHTPRHAMQTLGTEWGRDIMGRDFWVSIASKAILALPGHVVIDDIRFDNEAKMIRALGGRVIKLARIGHETVAGSHISEDGVRLSLIDMTLYNNGDTSDLCRAVTKVCTR